MRGRIFLRLVIIVPVVRLSRNRLGLLDDGRRYGRIVVDFRIMIGRRQVDPLWRDGRVLRHDSGHSDSSDDGSCEYFMTATHTA